MSQIRGRGRPQGSAKGKDKGRGKGVYNLDRAIFRNAIEELDFHPLKELIDIVKIPTEEGGLLPNERADVLLQFLPYMYPKLAAAELKIENPNASAQNEKVDRLYEELRTVLLDPRPKDIECNGLLISSNPLSNSEST